MSDDFLVVDRIFSVLYMSLLSEILYVRYIFITYNVALSSRTFPENTFLLSSYFRTHTITLLLQILGRRIHEPSPTSIFWKDRPPVPSKSPPVLAIGL